MVKTNFPLVFSATRHALRKDAVLPWRTSLALILAVLLFSIQPALASRGVRAAILMDMNTGRILFEKNADMPIPPASLTKVLSLFLILDAVTTKKIKLNERIRITSSAANVGGSSMHLRVGERVPVRALITGAAVASGNDAITALALRVGGTQKRFVESMNKKARALGMRNSVFKNPSGLPAAGQRSSPRDMALLARAYILAHPQALSFHSVFAFTHRHRYLTTTNTLLGVVPGVNGLKTGWTTASGYNIILTARRGKQHLLAVVMGGSSRRARDAMGANLLEAGFRHGNNIKQVYTAVGYAWLYRRHEKSQDSLRSTPKQQNKPSSRKAPSARSHRSTPRQATQATGRDTAPSKPAREITAKPNQRRKAQPQRQTRTPEPKHKTGQKRRTPKAR
ncbi:MAG: D-alanyl-D-alanine carboxypeptidase [Desulfovibrio sp.]|nr:D-alanyl-D-alanine carboxypeptidase [Desulfovibrio sp.]